MPPLRHALPWALLGAPVGLGPAPDGGTAGLAAGAVIDVPPERFAELVAQALDGIPPELGRLMDNVAVVVDDDSPRGELLGLYSGTPLSERSDYGGMVLPDKVTIFRKTMCASCDSAAELVAQVRTTVLHEVAHHFGIGDERLDELGWG